jgi:hypothetical protein
MMADFILDTKGKQGDWKEKWFVISSECLLTGEPIRVRFGDYKGNPTVAVTVGLGENETVFMIPREDLLQISEASFKGEYFGRQFQALRAEAEAEV